MVQVKVSSDDGRSGHGRPCYSTVVRVPENGEEVALDFPTPIVLGRITLKHVDTPEVVRLRARISELSERVRELSDALAVSLSSKSG